MIWMILPFRTSFTMGTDHREPVDIVLYLVSQIILIVLAIPAFIPRPAKVIILPGIGWYFYQVGSTQTTGDFNWDYALGSTLLSQYMVALDFAFITPLDKLGFHDKDPIKVNQRSFTKRLIWAFKLLSNPRCIGWAHEPSHLPPHWPSLSTPRSKFVLSRIFLAACCFLISGGTSTFHAAYASTTTVAVDQLATGAPFHWRVLLVLSFGLGTVCVLSGFNAILSAGAVGCGLSSPESWPLLFGSPLEAWSIQRFWRRFWHQMIRGYALSYTSSILGCVFPANYVGTTSYQLARLCIVFYISGIVHLCGDVMATGKLGFKSFTFFMSQALGITIEIVVSYLWGRFQSNRDKTTGTIAKQKKHDHKGNSSNKNGIKSLSEKPIPPAWVRCVGFIWVTLWMVWTAAYMVDVMISGHLMPPANPSQISRKFRWW